MEQKDGQVKKNLSDRIIMQLMFQWLKERWIILLYNLRNIVQKMLLLQNSRQGVIFVRNHTVDQCEMFLPSLKGTKNRL